MTKYFGMANDIIQETEGKLKKPEIRVWVHPPKGGDDYYYVFHSLEAAKGFARRTKGAEKIPLIAFAGFEMTPTIFQKHGKLLAKKKPKFKKKKGWYFESARHSLARKGIKTGRKKK